MFLNQDIIENFRLGTWEVDCVAMKLGQGGAPGPTAYTGLGHMRQNPDGTIGYKLYPPPPSFDPRALLPGPRGAA